MHIVCILGLYSIMADFASCFLLQTATDSATSTPIYWTEWSGWKCQDTFGPCLMTNTRNCSNFDPRDCELKLGGPHYELTTCRQEICPAHWLAWGEWKCKMGNRGTCDMTRTRECSTGSIDACGQISSETAPCEKQVCLDTFNLYQSGRCSDYNASSCSDVPSCSLIGNMHDLICGFGDTASTDCPKACGCCDEEPHWLQWSDWVCDRVGNNMCRMRRTRRCSTAHVKDCKGMSEIEAVCSDSICPAPSSQWSEWFYGKCSVSYGNGTTSRLRHCSTGRDVDCAGKPFETVPCTANNCSD